MKNIKDAVKAKKDFEFKKKKSFTFKKTNFANHIILFGCGNLGSQVLEQILSFKEDYVVVDHDNNVIKDLIEKEIHCVFGDVEDEELLENIDIEEAELMISTLPNIEDNYMLLKYLKNLLNQFKNFTFHQIKQKDMLKT